MSSDNLSAIVVRGRAGQQNTPLETVNQGMTYNEIYEKVNKHMPGMNYVLRYNGTSLPHNDNPIEISGENTKIIVKKQAPALRTTMLSSSLTAAANAAAELEVKAEAERRAAVHAARRAHGQEDTGVHIGGRRRRRRKTKRRKTSRKTKRRRTKRRRTKRRKSR